MVVTSPIDGSEDNVESAICWLWANNCFFLLSFFFFLFFFYFFAKHSHSNLLSRISVCFLVRQIFARFYSRRSKNLGETTRLIASSFPILKIEISEKHSRSKNFLKSQHSRGKGVAVPLYFAICCVNRSLQRGRERKELRHGG